MTDESHDQSQGQSHGMDPVEPTSQPAENMPVAEPAQASVLAGAGEFTSGEGLVSLAGMLLLAIWIIFDVFLDDYGVGIVTLLAAVLVVIAPRMRSGNVEKVLPLATIMKIAGYVIALITVFDIIEAVEEGFYEEASTIIAALAGYAAGAMAFIGARQIKT